MVPSSTCEPKSIDLPGEWGSVPRLAILPASRGLKSPLQCLNHARYGITWGVLGAAMACYEEAREYAARRIQFGKPIAALV